ncbi:MAG: hypothetical protein ACRCSY_04005 [Cetobacterium sp.]
MMKAYEVERLGKAYFVKESGDIGFENDEVFRVIQKIMYTRKAVRGMKKVFNAHLTTDGVSYALQFTEEWVELGMWKFMTKRFNSV